MSQIRTLQSWKEIAGYIGRGIRTVQRWEELGLPVHRPQPEARKSAVYAISHEVDVWLMNNSTSRPPPLSSPSMAQSARNGCKIGLQQVLITDDLFSRPLRICDRNAQKKALMAIGERLTDPPDKLLSIVMNHALDLCNAGSAGLSVLHKEDKGKVFHWDAMAGVLRDCIGQTTPREFSPCGVTLDRKSPQLFSHPERYFDYFKSSPAPLVEGLVIPIFVNASPLGTLWIVSHDEQHKFNSQDVSIMTNLAAVCEAAFSCMTQESAYRTDLR